MSFTPLRRRRGAAAMEFAMTFPVITLLFAGTVDYGHYFSTQAMVETIARDACRQGALVDPVNAVATATAVVTGLFTAKNIDCGTLACSISISYTDDTSGGLDYLDCQVVMNFQPLAGLLYFGTQSGLPAVPAQLQGRAVMPMDLQIAP